MSAQRTVSKGLGVTAVLIALLVGSSVSAWGLYVQPTTAPVERLIDNLARQLAELDESDPDPEARATRLALWARVNHLGLSPSTVEHGLELHRLPPVAPSDVVDPQRKILRHPPRVWVRKGPTRQQARRWHAAWTGYSQAIALQPSSADAAWRLGQAALAEQFGTYASIPLETDAARRPGFFLQAAAWLLLRQAIDGPTGLDARDALGDLHGDITPVLVAGLHLDRGRGTFARQLLAAHWRRHAARLYEALFRDVAPRPKQIPVVPTPDPGDPAQGRMPSHPTLLAAFRAPPVAVEAAQGLTRIWAARLLRPEPGLEAWVDRLLRVVEQQSEIWPGGRFKRPSAPPFITPLILPLHPGRVLEDLVDDHAQVPFDMDGSGVVSRWSWIRPDAGLVVWDPERRGRIRSGRDLIGAHTFGLPWRDAYDVLQHLDDNGDGWLTGAELKGLRVWQDRDGNGRSEPGEVRDLARHGVSALAVRATHTERGGPACRLGVRMGDGSQRASYDWMARRR